MLFIQKIPLALPAGYCLPTTKNYYINFSDGGNSSVNKEIIYTKRGDVRQSQILHFVIV
jgi:hypothetical protein